MSHSSVRVPIDLRSEQEEGNEDRRGKSPPRNADCWRPTPVLRRVDLTVDDSLISNPDSVPNVTKCVLLPKDMEGLRVLSDL